MIASGATRLLKITPDLAAPTVKPATKKGG
jgi:hypothetical protein